MAIAFTDAHVTVNGVDLSPYVRKVTLSPKADDLDATAMGGGGYRARIGGLKDWSVSLEFNQGFDVGEVDATLWPLFGTVVPLTVRPTSDPVSPTNPEYSGNVLIAEYPPFDQSTGDLATVSVSWPGDGPLNRATS